MELKLNKKNITGTLLVIFSLSVIFYSAYFFGQREAEKRYAKELQLQTLKNIAEETRNIEKANLLNEVADESSFAEFQKALDPVYAICEIKEGTIKTINSKSVVKKGDINWLEPKNLGDLGLTGEKVYAGCVGDENSEYVGYSSSGIKYIKSGEVVTGKYAGYDFIVVASDIREGPGNGMFFRILKKNNDIIFITNQNYGLEEYGQELIKKFFTQGVANRVFDAGITIEELDYPAELIGENKRQVLTRDQYGKAFFVDAKLKKVFVSEKYGQAWMTDVAKLGEGDPTPFELNKYKDYSGNIGYYDIFDRYGFYFKSPDGTAVAYKLKLDIFNVQERVGKLDVTWNSGKKNTIDFEENPSGCGGGKYVYDETAETKLETDLIAVGKTSQGDLIYGYKDTSLKGFMKMYDETYFVEEGKNKKSPEEFLKENPKVFWQDPFGRILAFYNTTFISPVECGKPVIYLYPKKAMNISVKVAPGNGLSFTDPEYGTGWNVFSDTKSNLTNLVDGKKYPYLFWEGSGSIFYETPQQGFVISANELDGFFNNTLAKLGLIEKEIADFKEFWLPKMQETKKPYYFITFLSKHYIDQLAPLAISPKPDTTIRVLMDYQGLDNFKTVPELKIKTPKRSGFVVAEWGGMLKK